MKSNITELDRYLYHEGTHYESYKFMGAKIVKDGVVFTLWAKNATFISVVGDFNSWNTESNPMEKIDEEGIWSVFVKGAKKYDSYKYYIINENAYFKKAFYKADPYAKYSEVRPKTASIIYEDDYVWNDVKWQEKNKKINILEQPISIYELNLASWKYKENGDWYTYDELADVIIEHVKENNFTHVEFMPLMEHPFDGSWGYQITGYYSPTSRYGTPEQLKKMIDKFHQSNIGVIFDWVPNHFCKDEHGLMYFDGEALYEPKEGILRENVEWGTMNFDYNVNQVNSFLISNAVYYLEEFHIDGIRVDAVAYMLYRHMRTGRYDLFTENDVEQSSIEFIKKLNQEIFRRNSNFLMIAEESSAYKMVTWPVYAGGLGFNLKWNMGWMHDTLKYFSQDPISRKYHHEKLTFSIYYAFNENFVLALSHDEVVHGKKSLISKMPGDYSQKFANLRLLISYQMFHPGKKLNFMGNEFAQFIEWNEYKELDWFLYLYDSHKKFNNCFKKLNYLYLQLTQLHQVDFDYLGYEWLSLDRIDDSVIAFKRIDKNGKYVICVLNFTPVLRENYPIPLTEIKEIELIFNSDDVEYGGLGTDIGDIVLEDDGENKFMKITLPPLSALLFDIKD